MHKADDKKSVLFMTLKKEWFDLIAIGEKRIEIRVVKPFWTRRLEGRYYDEILFRNGYQPDSPAMRVEYAGYTRQGGEYHISLGSVLEFINFKQIKSN